jgi:hypothetical protein
MALLNGIRCTLLVADSTLITVGPNILGFNGLNAAAGAVNGNTYQWVLEANFNNLGVATAREGGSGVYNQANGTLDRSTIWSTISGNAQIPITGTTHVIVTPMAEEILANTVVVEVSSYTVTTESALLIYRFPPGSGTISLPQGTARQGGPLQVKDVRGDALSNPTTINAFSGELIDGSSSAVINTNYGGLLLAPINLNTGGGPSFPFVGWYVIANTA